MEFDWKGAVQRYGDDLYHIVCDLIGLIRPAWEPAAGMTVPRHLHTRILATLRPAEFAARRLVAMAARVLDLPVPRVRLGSPGRRDQKPAKPAAGPEKPARRPVFQLFDPFKPFGDPWLDEDTDASEDPGAPPKPAPPADEPVDATSLWRRIDALFFAVENVEGQALRLARWRARRAAARAAGADAGHVRPCRYSPMRPGRPPGWKRRPRLPVERLLKDLSSLAHEAWEWPDTS
jgi:hypothetical protein